MDITYSNWYKPIELTVRATADSLYDRNKTLSMTIKQTFVVNDKDEPSKTLKALEVRHLSYDHETCFHMTKLVYSSYFIK